MSGGYRKCWFCGRERSRNVLRRVGFHAWQCRNRTTCLDHFVAKAYT